jgi:ABC-type transport system involved in Fe-S cluster assembly fused permease/ATPase subunit
MKQGKIEESGGHLDLLKKSAWYKNACKFFGD